MKQRIILNEHNKNILTTKYGMLVEQFGDDYWVKQVMSCERSMSLIFQRSQPDNIQRNILKRARKLRKKYINDILGLPGKGGSAEKQKRWHKQFDKTGLIRGNLTI